MSAINHTKGEVLIKVEGLSKKFCKDLKTSLWYGVKDLFDGLRGNKKERLLRSKEFWAVKDVNFELRRGECLGLIGHNGAGKSTLLKMLNGLIYPDAGTITIKGKVGALIELGAGFNPILTGRENIYNNGAVLGFSKEKIDRELSNIIAFAELEEFIDMPVQNYSSGMKVRLGFAVAAQMQPDVLIIDEVLAVGDLGFVLKCFKKIDNLLPNTAMVFVSHSMPMVSRICTQIILMESGKVKYQGEDIGKAIDLYYRRFSDNKSNVIFDDGSVKLADIHLEGVHKNAELYQLQWQDNLVVRIKLKMNLPIPIPLIVVTIFDKEQRPVAILFYDKKIEISKNSVEMVDARITHEKLQLSKGIYSLNITITSSENKGPLLRINDALTFQLLHKEEVWPPFLLESTYENLNFN